jgi:hypothetical protein
MRAHPYLTIAIAVDTPVTSLHCTCGRIQEYRGEAALQVTYPGEQVPHGNVTDPIKDIPGLALAGWTNNSLKPKPQTGSSGGDGGDGGRGRESLTGVAAAAAARQQDKTGKTSNLKYELVHLWNNVRGNKFAWPFLEPVDTGVVTDYLEVIKARRPAHQHSIVLRAQSRMLTLCVCVCFDIQLCAPV